MDATELRALADALEPMARAPRFEDFDVPAFCAWVRACADAKPVLWMQSDHIDIVSKSPFMCRCAPTQQHPDYVPLYTHPAPAAPQAERQPESEPTEAQIEAGARVLCHRHAELCNANEQDAWDTHCDEFRDDAAEVLRAALEAKDAT